MFTVLENMKLNDVPFPFLYYEIFLSSSQLQNSTWCVHSISSILQLSYINKYSLLIGPNELKSLKYSDWKLAPRSSSAVIRVGSARLPLNHVPRHTNVFLNISRNGDLTISLGSLGCFGTVSRKKFQWRNWSRKMFIIS